MPRLAIPSCCLVAFVLGTTSPVSGTNRIGVYAGSSGTDSGSYACVTQAHDRVVEFFVIAAEIGSSGFQGAEFRVTGLPAGTTVLTKEVHPGVAIELGDALGTGVNLAFSACQTDQEIVLLHYTVLLAETPTAGFSINISQHYSPSNANFACPLVTLCDAPAFTAECSQNHLPYLSVDVPATDPDPPDGAVGVGPDQTLTWVGGIGNTACGYVQGGDTIVHFGTDPDPPAIAGFYSQYSGDRTVHPGPLLPNTTYFWHVDYDYYGSVIGPLWSFTTGDYSVSVTPTSWHAVKRLYR